MKSKITKIQKILAKGIAVFAAGMMLASPMIYAVTSLDDSYLNSSWFDKLIYGEIGSITKAIEEWFESGETTLYITNETQLRALAEYVNNGNDCSGKQIILLNDIEIDKNIEWVPIGNKNIPFSGIFDGNNHKITNLSYIEKNGSALALFGKISESGIIRNLKIEELDINVSTNQSIKTVIDIEYGELPNTVTEITKWFDTGKKTVYIENETQLRALAEYVNNGNNCEGKEIILLNDIEINKNIEWIPIGNEENPFSGVFDGNNYNLTNLTYTKKTGRFIGLFGIVNESGIVRNLNVKNFNIDTILSSYTTDLSTGTAAVGNIAGMNKGIIENCTNTSNVTALYNAGGITGVNYGQILNCINEGNVEAQTAVAGIAGTSSRGGKIINCTNKGNIKGNTNTGGIAGEFGNEDTSIIQNCINTGEVSVLYNSETTNCLGGIAGRAGNYGTIKNSYNIGNILGIDNSTGGLVGQITNALNMYNCINNIMTKLNEFNVGDLVGEIKDSSGVLIKGCLVFDAFLNEESENVIDLSNGTTIKETYKITDILTEVDFSKISISGFDEIFEFNEAEGKIELKPTLNIGYTEQNVDTKTGLITNFEVPQGYFKEGDIVKVKIIFNRYLAKAYGPLTAITEAPTLRINNNIEMDGKISASTKDYTTTIEYTYTVKDGDDFNIETLTLSELNGIYALGSDYDTIHPQLIINSETVNVNNVIVDTTKPTVNTKVYVENMLETERYTAGKEILFEVKTSEAIQGLYEVPQIQVSFSESGVGKYNYSDETNKAGFAKCKSAIINLDGTTTWTFSYQIQERDEGNLEFKFVSGEITDLAGNKVNIKDLYTPSTDVTSELVKGESWADDLNVTYEFYKNSISEANKVTSQTYFTDTDDLIVVATYDKVLYVLFGKINDGDYSVPFSSKYASHAPSIYLNNESNLRSEPNGVKIIDKTKTEVQYEFKDIAKEYGIKKLTQVSSISSKNDNNNQKAYQQVTLNGQIGYSENYYEEYTDANAENVKYLRNNAIKTTGELDDILIDPIGVSTKIEKSNIYADTTAPTVEIIADKPNVTNANLIKYTFKFSEVIEGFKADDITVNNGVKVTEEVTVGEEVVKQPKFVEVVKGLEYTLEVEPTITAGNEGIVQVIVEKGAVKDLVAIENVRQENTIKIDKVVPTVEIKADKDYVKADEKITYTFTWSEEVVSTFKEGVIITNGEIVDEITQINDLQYTMGIKPTNGNDVEVLISNGKTKDLAGNENIEAKHIITVIPTVQITTDTTNPTNKNEIEYTFTWSEEINGFTKEDIILPNGVEGSFEKVNDTTYKMVVNYNSLIPSGNEGEVKVAVVEKAVKDSNGNENAYTTNTLKIDRIAPIFIGLEAYATSDIKLNQEVDVVKEYYKAGDKITIVATFSENVIGDTNLVLQFSESGTVKENIQGKISEENKNKIVYTYTIKDGDNGILSVKALNGKVTDIASNETTITKKTLDGNTIIADTNDPSLKELNIVSPSTGVYKAGTDIIIEAIYDEAVYALNNNEIKNITSKFAPTLKVKFEEGQEREATFNGYVGEDKTKLKYTIKILDGENGLLSITAYTNKENVKVCDIAGNEAGLNKNQAGNEITADTIRPEVINIAATVENPTIDNTGIYYKAGNEIKITVDFSEEVSAAKLWSRILIGFSEDERKEPTSYKEILDLNATTAERIYTYTIKDGDNGYLWVKVEEGHYADDAGNVNIAKAATRIISKEIYADTEDPYLSTNSNGTTQWEIENIKNADGITTGIRAVGIFNEKIFSMNDNNLVELKDIPTMGVFVNNVLQKTGGNPKVQVVDGRTKLTYEINITDIDTVGTLSVNFIDGKVYDRAGNVMSIEIVDGDITSPIFKDIKVVTPNGFYKAGEVIEIVARFEEETKLATLPTLEIRVGNKVTQLQGEYSVEDPENTDTVKVARYKYTVVNGDKGAINIVSLMGNVTDGVRGNNISQIYLDLNNDEVNDVNGRPEQLLNNMGSQYANDDKEYVNVIADTEAPILTITSDVQKTNKDVVTYTFTWSEIVTGFTKDDIEVINASKAEFKQTDTEGKVYTLTVDTLEEGRQSVKVNAEVCEDRAGNLNSERVIFNDVVIDCTNPIIRAKVNGGNYVIATDTNKSVLKETIVVNEELSKFEYAWSTSKDIETITEWTEEDVSKIVVNSDINLENIANSEGTYYLYLKVTDIAGNTLTVRTKEFIVSKSTIELVADIEEVTNQDVTVTVSYKEGLTEDRKAGISGKTQSADSSKVIVSENGIVYAEAMDKAGNKVYNTKTIDYIDKVAPEATIEYVTNEDGSVTAKISFNEENVTITNNNSKDNYTFKENGQFKFEFKDAAGNTGEAIAEVTTIIPKDEIAPNIIFNYTLSNVTLGNPIGATILTDEDAKISYKWDDGEWITSEEYITSINVTNEPKFEKVYTLYAKAIDKAGNSSDIQKLEFTVVEEIKLPEIIFEDIPTIQIDGVKYVKVSSNMTTEELTNKMNKEALCGKTPEYIKLTEDNKLKTGSEITINGSTKYVIVVNGDVDCDGKVTFLGDVVMANNYRIGQVRLSTLQKLAADINNNGEVDFISDIIAMNNYRLGIIKSL